MHTISDSAVLHLSIPNIGGFQANVYLRGYSGALWYLLSFFTKGRQALPLVDLCGSTEEETKSEHEWRDAKPRITLECLAFGVLES